MSSTSPVPTGEPVGEIRYLCQRCGNCCRWPGVVRLGSGEVEPIARLLQLEPEVFVNEWCELLPDRRGLTLKSRADGSCVFLEGINHCRIQGAKPQQCRDFPNRWRFPGWREVCEAIEIVPRSPL